MSSTLGDKDFTDLVIKVCPDNDFKEYEFGHLRNQYTCLLKRYLRLKIRTEDLEDMNIRRYLQ